MSDRILKINELLKREISNLLERELGGELGILTITSVETTKDLHQAIVWFSPMEEKKIEEISRALGAIRPEIQKILNKKLILKYVPRINFKLDESFKNINKVEELLDQIKEDE